MEISEIINLGLLGFLGVALTWLWGIYKQVRDYIEHKVTVEDLVFVKELALSLVSTLAQAPAFESLPNVEKKERAIVWLTQLIKDYGLDFNFEDIDRLIEEAVLAIKE